MHVNLLKVTYLLLSYGVWDAAASGQQLHWRINSSGLVKKNKTKHTDLVTLQCLETLSRLYVPDFDGRVSVPRHQDVVFELHAAGEGLMTRQRVYAVPRLDIPHADGRV